MIDCISIGLECRQGGADANERGNQHDAQVMLRRQAGDESIHVKPPRQAIGSARRNRIA